MTAPSTAFEFASMYELRAAVFMLDKPSAVTLTVRKNTAWNVLVLTYTNADGERFTNEFDCGHTRADTLEAYADAYKAAQAYARSANMRAAQDSIPQLTQPEPVIWIALAAASNGASLHQSRAWFAVCKPGQLPTDSAAYFTTNKIDSACKFLHYCNL